MSLAKYGNGRSRASTWSGSMPKVDSSSDLEYTGNGAVLSPFVVARRYFRMMSSNGSFHVGDKVVYPNHGVGVIEQISSRTMGATVENFYLLKISSSSLKVMVPFHSVGTVGMRRVVKNAEIQK